MTVAVPEASNFSHSFGSGIAFTAGQIPQVQIDRNTNNPISVTVTGYITKKI
ncbi:MAG: hypothetical protein IPN34_13270 [Planctomycetes bacterium]|nr:hypothetical protein [Planctomycetota bacterium]